MNVLKLILRLFIYWCVAVIFSAIIVSIFSSFLPPEKYRNFTEFYDFNSRSLAYFKLTIQFFVFVGGLIAAPGFILNFLVYFFRRKEKGIFSNKLIAMIINLTVASIIMYFYHTFNISRPKDFFYVIFPVYMLSIFVWGILILPGRQKIGKS
jgi:hypothetical protein